MQIEAVVIPAIKKAILQGAFEEVEFVSGNAGNKGKRGPGVASIATAKIGGGL